MNRKNIIIVSAVANAALLVILFISAVVSREDRKNPSSVEVASAILEKNPDGMVSLSQEVDKPLQKKEIKPFSAVQVQQVASTKELIPLPLSEEITETSAPVQGESQLVHKLPESVSAGSPTEVVLVNPPYENTQEKVASQEKVSQEKKESFIEVVVKKGDSLDKLAHRHHSSIQAIKKANNLEGSFLQVGKTLRVPVRELALKTTDNQKKNSLTTSEGSEYYVIKQGDNPWTVAIKHHLKVEELLRLNHMTKEKAKKLRPGDKLRIR